MVKAHCSVCGKDFEAADSLKTFVEKYPDRVKCPDCYKAGGSDTKKATSKAKANTTTKSDKEQMSAELLRKSYDEVKAAFADVIDEVHDFIGGWTTSIALSKTK
jgi:ribosome-binding protein aMBF1 (putative translation factor)